jgi:ferric-dicitrate binding protein FerR (iron transport regulator)
MNYHQIKEYLEGRTAESETEEVQKWLRNLENDAESRKILGELWANSNIKLIGQEPDFEQMLSHVHQLINTHQIPVQIHQHKLQVKKTSFFEVFSKVAAILIVPLILLSLYFYFNPRQNGNPLMSSYREIYTKPGTRTKIELSDGTKVWMNDGTTFRYPEKFTGDRREVYVDGEAYFEVKSDVKHPFVVNNPMMNTLVTGTHFNLNAYSEDNYFEATLQEGKINLEKNKLNVDMVPGEQVQFDNRKENIVKKNVDPSNASAWIDGKLIFNDEKLGTAIKKLARWYNVEIILSNAELTNYLLTGTIRDEKLDQTLRLISLAVPVKFEFKKEINPTKIQRTIYMMKK